MSENFVRRRKAAQRVKVAAPTIATVPESQECAVCFAIFDKPIGLLCGHTFCKVCLQRVIDSQTNDQVVCCPVCRECTPAPNGFLTCMPTEAPHIFVNGHVMNASQNNTTSEPIEVTPIMSDKLNRDVTENKDRILPRPIFREDVNEVPAAAVDESATQLTKATQDSDTSQVCTNCDPDEKLLAVSYCRECGNYMCNSCQRSHSQWKGFTHHRVIDVSEACGKACSKSLRRCMSHPGEDKNCFCLDCGQYICIKCLMLEHAPEGHRLLDASVHEARLEQNVQELKDKATAKRTTINRYIDLIKEQRPLLGSVTKRISDSIQSAFDDYVQELRKKKETLENEVKTWISELDAYLLEMEASSRQEIARMNWMEEKMCDSLEFMLEKQAYIAHDSLCRDLEAILRDEDPNTEQPPNVTKRAERLRFYKYEKPTRGDSLSLGYIREDYGRLALRKEIQFPVQDSMNSVTPSTEGGIAVGSHLGGIYLYGPDGQLQQTVLPDIKVMETKFLSDGRCVVRDMSNIITLYTPLFKKIKLRFLTRSVDNGGHGGLAVDCYDRIYVGYRKTRTIQVFIPEGGKAIREITCGDSGYKPMQMFSMNTKQMILVKGSNRSLMIIDSLGEVKNSCVRDGDVILHPTICHDDSIMVASVRQTEGLLRIDHYTSDLKHMKTLLQDYRIQVSKEREWYYLQQYQNDGAIAFCTPDSLHIFGEEL